MGNQDLTRLLDAEALYLREAGWTYSPDISRSGTCFTVWKSPHDGDEYAQPSAVRMQKIEDGYLPRVEQKPLSYV